MRKLRERSSEKQRGSAWGEPTSHFHTHDSHPSPSPYSPSPACHCLLLPQFFSFHPFPAPLHLPCFSPLFLSLTGPSNSALLQTYQKGGWQGGLPFPKQKPEVPAHHLPSSSPSPRTLSCLAHATAPGGAGLGAG